MAIAIVRRQVVTPSSAIVPQLKNFFNQDISYMRARIQGLTAMALSTKEKPAISSPPEYLLRSASKTNLSMVDTSGNSYQAAVCEELKKPLVVKDLPRQPLKNSEVRIKVEYCGINYADILKSMGLYQERPELPFVPGCEPAGTIIEVGRDVTGYQIGDRVIALMRLGGYADECVNYAKSVWKLPDNVSLQDATAGLASYGTAHMALIAKAGTQIGETVLVSGAAGSVGLAAVDIAANVIGAKVIAIVGDDEKIELAKDRGATYVINHRKQDVRKEILAITNKRGVNVMIDNVGGDMFKIGLRSIAMDGRIVPIGFASGQIPSIPANILLVKNVSVIGLFWSNYELFDHEKFSESVTTILQLCSEKKIRPHYSKVFPYNKVNQAFKFILGRKSTGKVLLCPNH